MAAKVLLLAGACNALVAPSQPTKTKLRAATLEEVERIPTPAFGKTFGDDVSKLKAAIFHYGATLDRGQGFNPTTGEQYKDRMDRAVAAVEALCEKGGAPDVSPEKLRGRWELVFSSVPHGIFRSSPFFEAIYDSYANVGKPDKAELFFKLHELQTMSWGASKIGRVAQTIDPENNMLYSEFDTQIFSLTARFSVSCFASMASGAAVASTPSTPSRETHTQPRRRFPSSASGSCSRPSAAASSPLPK